MVMEASSHRFASVREVNIDQLIAISGNLGFVQERQLEMAEWESTNDGGHWRFVARPTDLTKRRARTEQKNRRTLKRSCWSYRTLI